MNTRDEAIERLKKLIREQRARIDPAVMQRAQDTAEAMQAGRQGQAKKESQSVPYDRKAAARAVELFLAGHQGGKAFQEKLLAFLRKNSQ